MEIDKEPSRSVLFRSAASLALELGELKEAHRLIAAALSGEPPEEIYEELNELMEETNFQIHLSQTGTTLLPGEFGLHFSGESIGPGYAHPDVLRKKINSTELLILRTSDRTKGLPFARTTTKSKKELELFVSVAEAASIAIKFRIGWHEQYETSKPLFSAMVVEELFTCLDLYSREKEIAIKERMNDDAYFQNFLALASEIAPDGKEVKRVNVVISKDNAVRKFALFRPLKPTDFLPLEAAMYTPQEPFLEQQLVGVEGELRFANSMKDPSKVTIKLKGDSKLPVESIEIRVPDGMSDVVKQYWQERVLVVGTLKGKRILELKRIGPLDKQKE